MGKSTVLVGSIVIDVDNFAQMMTFWQEALGYAPGRPPTPDDPFVILKDPTGKGPNVSIDQMEPCRGRLHLDLYTDDPDREVERLLQLGATVYRPREPGEDFVVLATILYLMMGNFDPQNLWGTTWGRAMLAALILSLGLLIFGIGYVRRAAERMLKPLNEENCTPGPEVAALQMTSSRGQVVALAWGFVILILMVVATGGL